MSKTTKIFLVIAGIFIVLSLMGADCNIVQNVLGGKSGTLATKEDFKNAVTAVATLLAGASGTVAIIFLVYGGVQYIGSAGNQETATKAKQTVTNSIFGLVIIVCSYVIVYWFMNFVSTGTVGF